MRVNGFKLVHALSGEFSKIAEKYTLIDMDAFIGFTMGGDVSENTGVNCEPGVPNIVNLPSTESGEERCRTESSVSFPSTYNLCVSSTIHSTKPASQVWSSALVLIVLTRIVKSKRAEKATAFTLLIAIPHRSSSIKKLWGVYQKNTQFTKYEHKNIPQVIDKAFTVPFVRKPLFSNVAPKIESI